MSLATLTTDLERPRTGPALEGSHSVSAYTADSQSQRAFDALARFIPTEALAPYIMAMQIATSENATWNADTVYWVFVVITPILLVIFEFARTASSGKPWPNGIQLTWRAFAAGIAFAVWGLSVPGTSYQDALGGVAFTGLMAVSISPMLTAIDSIAMRLIRDKGKKMGGQ